MALSSERRHQIGTALAWVAMWTGAALILRGHTDAFGSVLPLLAAGSFAGLALPGHTGVRAYLVGSLIVWTAMLAGTAIVLGGTAFLWPVLGLFAVGACYFLIVIPIHLVMAWPDERDDDRTRPISRPGRAVRRRALRRGPGVPDRSALPWRARAPGSRR